MKNDEVQEKIIGTATVSGSVETVIFRNERTEYTVIELLSDTAERIVAVGKMPYIAEGEVAVLHGTWVHHAEYGKQFFVES